MIDEAVAVIDQAVAEYRPVAVYALLSGGHDSLTSTSIAARHPAFTAAVHLATGIGIPQTREFVEQTCRNRGWPLIVRRAEVEYETLVLERGGFPRGPKSHASCYWFLKQRQLDAVVREAKTKWSDRVVLVTGIRRSESRRRMAAAMAVPIHRRGAKVWTNPILDWSALDCSRHIAADRLERNPVVDLLHRSGECLCGALARQEEIHEIDRWYPDVGARIHALEAKARAAGLAKTRWASTESYRDAEPLFLPLCVGCDDQAP